jgi:hypothetical protein
MLAEDDTDFYRREAQRLRDLAQVFVFSDTRAQLNRLVEHYEEMAGQTADAAEPDGAEAWPEV